MPLAQEAAYLTSIHSPGKDKTFPLPSGKKSWRLMIWLQAFYGIALVSGSRFSGCTVEHVEEKLIICVCLTHFSAVEM